MSAEKEIVNQWLLQQHYFTVNTLKVKNRDIGILALKFDKDKIKEALHVEVACSISGSLDTASFSKISRLAEQAFLDPAVKRRISTYIKGSSPLSAMLIVGGLPRSRSKEITGKLEKKGISVMAFEDILLSVISCVDTQYYQDDVLRSMQLMKFLLLSNPKALASLVTEQGILNHATRKQFLAALLDLEQIQKGMTTASEEHIIALLRHVSFKQPGRLADLLDEVVLNRRTRKPFMEAMLDKERIKRLYPRHEKKRLERPLSYFFR